ncbi:MAG: ArsR family transcriptional regulator [Gammaproteobacteria bacterium]|nr:ArsR family transcriptional regulator [Psychrosphaera sp.]NRA56254.1 ArsR family transcriptional regulator [Gammaproteobacteria bacterium]
MALQQIKNEHERLSILRSLHAMTGFGANNSMVRDGCAEFGVDMSNDLVKTHLTWLAEQSLVRIENKGAYLIAELTARGQDVVEGLTTVLGIKRPRASD